MSDCVLKDNKMEDEERQGGAEGDGGQNVSGFLLKCRILIITSIFSFPSSLRNVSYSMSV